MRRLSPLLVVLLALSACKSDPPATAAEPAAVAADASPAAPVDSAAATPDGGAETGGDADTDELALLGTWECSGGVPAEQVTFALGTDGSHSAMLSPMTGDANDDQTATWTLEPALLTLETPDGQKAYHRLVIDGDELTGMDGEAPFSCSRLGGG